MNLLDPGQRPMQNASLADRLRTLDQKRPSLPGEHWAAFAMGLYLLMRRRRSVLGRIGSVAAGITLVARALSGRDGAIAMWRRVEQGGGSRARPDGW